MKMRAGGVPSRTNFTNYLPFADVLVWPNFEAGQMAVTSTNAVGVFDLYQVAIAAGPPSSSDDAWRGGHHRSSKSARQVDSRMTSDHAVERITSPPKARTDCKPIQMRARCFATIRDTQRPSWRWRIPLEHLATEFLARPRWQRSRARGNRLRRADRLRETGRNGSRHGQPRCQRKNHDLAVSSMTSSDQPADQLGDGLLPSSNIWSGMHADPVKMVGRSHFRLKPTGLFSLRNVVVFPILYRFSAVRRHLQPISW